MSANMALLSIKMAACWALLWPTIALFQSPGQPGRLVINSKPEQGAAITINGQAMKQLTNTTFVVSPGNYKVTVKNRNGNVSCPSQDFSVSAGQETTVTCSGTHWE
jgi:hypothetical protein